MLREPSEMKKNRLKSLDDQKVVTIKPNHAQCYEAKYLSARMENEEV